MLYNRFKGNLLVNLLGQWLTERNGESFRPYPYSGLCYYLSPPEGMRSVINDPLHFIFFIAITLVICVFLSSAWIRLSGSSAKDVRVEITQGE